MDTIYEVEMVGFHIFGDRLKELLNKLGKSERQYFLDGLRHNLVKLMNLPRFRETLIEGTGRPHNVRTRFDMWTDEIKKALERYDDVIKKTKLILDLQRKSTACWLCTEHITSFEDAHLSEENGEYRLVHLYHSIQEED